MKKKIYVLDEWTPNIPFLILAYALSVFFIVYEDDLFKIFVVALTVLFYVWAFTLGHKK